MLKLRQKMKYKVTLNKISNYSKFTNLDSFHSTNVLILKSLNSNLKNCATPKPSVSFLIKSLNTNIENCATHKLSILLLINRYILTFKNCANIIDPYNFNVFKLKTK